MVPNTAENHGYETGCEGEIPKGASKMWVWREISKHGTQYSRETWVWDRMWGENTQGSEQDVGMKGNKHVWYPRQQENMEETEVCEYFFEKNAWGMLANELFACYLFLTIL